MSDDQVLQGYDTLSVSEAVTRAANTPKYCFEYDTNLWLFRRRKVQHLAFAIGDPSRKGDVYLITWRPVGRGLVQSDIFIVTV